MADVKLAGLVPQQPDSVVTISPYATIAEAAQEMRARHIGCLVVEEPPRKIAGILTERDILTRVVAPGIDAGAVRVRDYMTTDVVTIPHGRPITEAQEVMATHNVRHLPVLADGMVVGIHSSRDLIAQQVLKDRAMRAAAEEVAMLSTSLRSLDFDEVVQMVTREVPKIFTASRSAFLLGWPVKPNAPDPLTICHHCRCTHRELVARWDAHEALKNDGVYFGPAPEVCCRGSHQCPSVLIRISMALHSEQNEEASRDSAGFLCMCEMKPPEEVLREVIAYKARLVQEILYFNLTNAKLHHESQRQAMTDALTGVGTRRLMEDRLEAEFARAQRYRRPFIVAMLDVDDYKEVNDRLGHQAGDQVLRELGACLNREKRLTDILARYGGDEFVLLMPETTLADAVCVMDRIRQKVKRIRIPQDLSISISCGIAEQPTCGGINPNELIRRADIALYQAKKRGRDRTETWDAVTRAAEIGASVNRQKIKQLEGKIARLSVESKEIFVQSVYGLVQALEARDPYTRSHSENVMRYSVGIAATMGKRKQEIDLIRRSAMIHDIGKIGVPDSILRKPGKLTREERRIMEEHPLIAVNILDQMRFLGREMAIVRHHHEHWDGRGYPAGIAGQAIPYGARVLAVADAFDAITSDRVYREGGSLPEAVRTIADAAGTQFDPQVVNGMKRWIAAVEKKLGEPGKLTPADLLETQKGCVLAA